MRVDPLTQSALVAERLAALRDSDPLRAFEPYPKQRAFAEATTKEAIFTGANRTGKTKMLAAMVASFVRWGTLNPLVGRQGICRPEKPAMVWCTSLTNGMSRKLMQPCLFNNGEDPGVRAFIPASEIADYKDKPEPTLYGKAGWRITFKSADQGPMKFEGAAVDLHAVDEPPPWTIYKALGVRVGPGRAALIRMAGTLLPPSGQTGGVVQWLWSEKIEPWLNNKNRDMVIVVNAAMRDNPHLFPPHADESVFRDVLRTYPAGSLDRRIRVDGELLPGLGGNRVYGAFQRRVHVNPSIGPASVDPLRPILFTLDSNVAPLCALVIQQFGTLYRVLDEIIIERQGSMGRLAQMLRERYADHRAEVWIYGDQMANRAHAQTGQTDYELFTAGLGDWAYRVCLPVKNPPERDRVNVVNHLLGADGATTRVEVSSTCAWLIADLEQVLWRDDGSGIRKSRDSQDPYYQRTHISDALGYLLYAREPRCIGNIRTARAHTIAIPSPVYGFHSRPR